MKIIVPMAGRGKRMRPHTLTIPKPLLPIAGKPIVQRLVEDIARMSDEKIEEIAFIIGDFGDEVERNLLDIADRLGAKGSIYYQDQPLGTAHAILCAEPSLDGNVIVAFADTLFIADFKVEIHKDGIIWTHKVEDPTAFGVVKTSSEGVITDFIEKPSTFVSDQAIIGIYYFRDGENLKNELKYIIDNNVKDKGEYQLTSALENMKNKGKKFFTGAVEEWLDCGNKDATVYTNQRVLEFNKHSKLISKEARITNSQIIEPCFIGKDVEINNSVIGPHVSIGEGTKIYSSVIENTIIQQQSVIKNKIIANSMIGNDVEYIGKKEDISLGDYSTIYDKN